jgi:hypothetical protein
MNTAVQLRTVAAVDLPRCDLVHGSPLRFLAGDLGPIALLAPGEVVAYRLRSRRLTRLFVFRTLDIDDRLAAFVPGVRPRVRLLIAVRSAGRVRLARNLFAHLTKTGRNPSHLTDAFFLRVGVALAGRLPSREIPPSLLRPSSRAPPGAIAHDTRRGKVVRVEHEDCP